MCPEPRIGLWQTVPVYSVLGFAICGFGSFLVSVSLYARWCSTGMPKVGLTDSQWRERLQSYVNGTYDFGRGQRPSRTSRWSTVLAKIEKCPRHRNPVSRNPFDQQIACLCGYHTTPPLDSRGVSSGRSASPDTLSTGVGGETSGVGGESSGPCDKSPGVSGVSSSPPPVKRPCLDTSHQVILSKTA